MKKFKLNKKRKLKINDIFNRRVNFFVVICILLFIVVFIKLCNLMIIDNKKYNKKLEELSYTVVEGSSAPRGRILDRNHKVIVDNIASRVIYYKKNKGVSTDEEISLAYKISSIIELDYSKLKEKDKRKFWIIIHKKLASDKITAKEREKYAQRKLSKNELDNIKMKRVSIEELNNMTEEEVKAAYVYYLMNNGYTYDEKVIKSGNVKDEEYAYISENYASLNGFNTRLDWERTYPYGDVFKTILGKVSSFSQGIPLELKSYYLEKGYSLNDRVGISYLEKQYEKYLRGKKEKYQVINSHELKLLKDGKRGNDIVLTIDIELQKQVEEVLSDEVRNTKGEMNTAYYDHSSAIIADPNTGEILAMASKKIVGDRIVDNTESILTSPITPGSVVKGASILVGYNTGAVKIGEYKVDECIKIKGTNEKCSWKTLGSIDDITALAKSSNTYQFKTAIRVSGYEYKQGMSLPFSQEAFDLYRNMYHSFGLGVKTEIDLPVESEGYGAKKDSRAGNLLDFVIGQYETYTPLQLSQYVSTIANGGTRLAPYLLKEVRKATTDDSLGEVLYEQSPRELNKIDTSEEYMARVKEGFYAVMNSAGGYGVGYMDQAYSPAGKTGTSQSFIDTDNDGVIDTETITSSFVGYAPSFSPRMSIIVTSPNSSMPSGNDYASSVTKRISKRLGDVYFTLYP